MTSTRSCSAQVTREGRDVRNVLELGHRFRCTLRCGFAQQRDGQRQELIEDFIPAQRCLASAGRVVALRNQAPAVGERNGHAMGPLGGIRLLQRCIEHNVHPFYNRKDAIVMDARLIESADRPTTVKTRFVAEGQQVLRADQESSLPLPEQVEVRLLSAYRDTKAFSSDKKAEFKPKFGDSLLYEHHTTSLVFNDPPLHTRVRRLIAGALTPRAIAAMEPSLVALVDDMHWADDALLDLLADVAARANNVPLLLLATARPDLLERRPDWGGGTRHYAPIALEVPSSADTARPLPLLLPRPRGPARRRTTTPRRPGWGRCELSPRGGQWPPMGFRAYR